MPREKEFYRENLQTIIEHWPDREMLPLKEVALWMGVDIRSLQKQAAARLNPFPLKKIASKYVVSRCDLARWLS